MSQDQTTNMLTLHEDTGTDHTGKGAMYDPSIKQKCRQLVCSVRSAIIITVCAALFIIAVALIAAFAWPNFVCECPKKNKVITPTPPPPTEPPTDFPWKLIRLPKSVVPLLYSIHMQTNMTSFAFNGSVTIDIKITEATDFIVIHSQHLNIGSKSLTCKGRQLEIRTYKENKAYNQLYLGLAEKLATGTECQLYMVFNANLSIALHGYYKSSYLDKNNKRRYLATTHFEATHARSAFPCFDEPEMKANFTMTMIHEDEYKALFNMPRTHLEELGNGLKESKFQTSVKMSTYLVAFVVCDYENITDVTKGGVTVSVYAPPHQIEEAEFALTAAVKILDYYDTFFGVPYPLPKQDLIAIPDFNAGAMENWGLITYRMTAILYKENVSSSGNKQYVASVVAHELAHQWFGNLVTMKWWNDLWLNEGFASYVEYLGVNVVAPDWKLLDQFIVETLQSALGSDSLSNSHPISVPVHDPSEINEMFDAISYNKGSSLIRMIKGFIGGAALQSGLKDYLTKYQFSNAQTDDLWNALSDQVNGTKSQINVKDVMDTWTLQMGYPMVTLQWDRQTGKVTAKQERFLLFPQSHLSQEFTSPYGYKWYIPLSVITDQSALGTQDMQWMKKDSVTFDVPMGVKWIKANVNMTGFYRVQYDEDNWRTIIDTLQQDINVMSAADRASVLDDAFALARAGHLKTSIALDLSEYLDKETEYVPWAVGLGNLEYIGKLLEGKPAHQNYTKYITRLMRKWIDKIGWNDSGPHLRKYLRALILGGAVKMGDVTAVTEARKMFNNWMTKDVPVSVNLKNVVYGGGVQHGGELEWKFVWDKYNQATVPTEKKKLLIALARSANADVINRYLHWSLDDTKVRSQDTVSVVTRLASNSAAGRILAWHFIRENWDLIYKRYGETAFKMQSLIKGVVGGFTNKFDQQEVKSFFERVPVGSGKRAVNQALEAIQMNVDWMEKHEKEVTDWFSNKA